MFWKKKCSMRQAGDAAPDFSLPDTRGNSRTLGEGLTQGPLLLAFFKVSCPTCQFTFPFIQRLHEKLQGSPLTIWGVSQNDADDTREFCKEFELTFPVLIDDPSFAVSNDYGLTNVPTLFLIDSGGRIVLAEHGFSRKALEKVDAQFAPSSKDPRLPFFSPSEIIPDYKPG
jgi:peroxiredoxin